MAKTTCGLHRIVVTTNFGAQQRFAVEAYIKDLDGQTPDFSATGLGPTDADFLQSILDKIGSGYKTNTALCLCTQGQQIVRDQNCSNASAQSSLVLASRSDVAEPMIQKTKPVAGRVHHKKATTKTKKAKKDRAVSSRTKHP